MFETGTVSYKSHCLLKPSLTPSFVKSWMHGSVAPHLSNLCGAADTCLATAHIFRIAVARFFRKHWFKMRWANDAQRQGQGLHIPDSSCLVSQGTPVQEAMGQQCTKAVQGSSTLAKCEVFTTADHSLHVQSVLFWGNGCIRTQLLMHHLNQCT